MQIRYTSFGALSTLILIAPDPSKINGVSGPGSDKNAAASETRLPEAWKSVWGAQVWKLFIRVRCFDTNSEIHTWTGLSHYFDDADFTGGKLFGTKILLGVGIVAKILDLGPKTMKA